MRLTVLVAVTEWKTIYYMKRYAAYSLVELLVAMLILAQIATFTIPKVLTAQQNQRDRSVTKEAAAIITGAYSAYLLEATPAGNAQPTILLPYINYVKYDTSTVLDGPGTVAWTINCDAANPCIKLHNGGMLRFPFQGFGGTGVTSAFWFHFDPDGKDTQGSAGQGQVVQFAMYYNGRITTIGNITPGTCDSQGCNDPNPSWDPPWFSWD